MPLRDADSTKPLLPDRGAQATGVDRRQVLKGLQASALAATVSPALSACSKTAGAARPLTFWTIQLAPQFNGFMGDLLSRFEAGHPGVRVRWVDVPWSDVVRKLLAAVAAGTAPDVVNLNPQFAARLAEAGALADPSEYMSVQEAEGFLPGVWNANRFQGRLFAVPWYLSTPISIINRRLFQAARLDPPSHLHDMPALAAEFRKRTGRYAYFPALDGSRPLEDMVLLGARLLNDAGDGAGFNTPEGRAAFGFYQRLYQSNAVPRSVMTAGHQKAVDLFQSGALGMLVTGMDALGGITLNAPALVPDLDFAPPPAGVSVPASIAAMNLAVPESARDKAAAFALVRFVTSAPWQERFTRLAPVLPSTRVSLERLAPREADIFSRARILSAGQLSGGAVLVPPLRRYTKLLALFQRKLQGAMLGRLSVDEAVVQAARGWDGLLAGVQGKPA